MPPRRHTAQVPVDPQARAAQVVREMRAEDTSAPVHPSTSASMTLQRVGRVTAGGRRGTRTVRKLCAYVSPETAAETLAAAAREGLTISDFIAEALNHYCDRKRA